ncbi:Replication E1 [Gossypium arboreum]|uniref:Replication E1 n=1 Tax=Gossypium arboreum TaxID=29729 RepID=A0A0B0MUZ1_GOSAR|nr:Replication E1 [Gossypium arboreum]
MERVLLIAVHPVEFSTDMKLLQPCSVCFPVLLPSSQCSISTSGVQFQQKNPKGIYIHLRCHQAILNVFRCLVTLCSERTPHR